MEYTNGTILAHFKEYEISQTTLEKLKKILLLILKDIHNVCEEHNLHYCLCGGTLLGSIRHKGFIPWDDDVDIMMLRKDYEKLADLIQHKYPEKYFITNLNDSLCPHRMMKIMLKGTAYVDVLRQNHPYFSGIFVDVFPIDYIPQKHKFRKLIFNFATKAFFTIHDFRYPSQIVLDKCKTSPVLRRYYYKRRAIGAVLNLLGGRNFYATLLNKLATYKKATHLQGIPLGIYYDTEVFSTGTFDDRLLTDFCDEQFYIPKNYDMYLKNLYKDYMKMPPEDKRRRHQVAKLDFGKYDFEVQNEN